MGKLPSKKMNDEQLITPRLPIYQVFHLQINTKRLVKSPKINHGENEAKSTTISICVPFTFGAIL